MSWDFCGIAGYPLWPSNRVNPVPSDMIALPSRTVTSSVNNPTIFVKFHNIQSLLCSASDGCHLCGLLVEEISEDDVTRLLDVLAGDPAVAWEQMKVLIWRYENSLIV
jgi:hypothetical protein